MNAPIQYTPVNTLHFLSVIVSGSFDKKFGSMPPDLLLNAMGLILRGLSQEQIQAGLDKVMQRGYCPDLAIFRKWCLGETEYDFSDAVADTYIGKNGALANIVAWLASDRKTAISEAEYAAYTKVACLFSADNAYNLQSAYGAFKDHYEAIVRDLVEKRKPCQEYKPPLRIVKPKPAQFAPEAKREVASQEVAQEHLMNLQKTLERVKRAKGVASL